MLSNHRIDVQFVQQRLTEWVYHHHRRRRRPRHHHHHQLLSPAANRQSRYLATSQNSFSLVVHRVQIQRSRSRDDVLDTDD